MKKKSLTIILAVAIIVCMIPFGTLTAFADDPHTHKDATNADVIFEPISNLDQLKNLFATGGNGYLLNDITADGVLNVNVADVNLCLNDKVLDFNKNGNINIGKDISFALYDCGNTKHYYDKDADGLWTLKASGESKYFTFGGVITGGSAENGGGVLAKNGNFTMYGGNICGNTAVKPALESGSVFGGGVGIKGGTFTMKNGTIRGNLAAGDGFGGGVGVREGTFTMKDGTISDNIATYGGGVLTYQPASLTIEKGTISDNKASKAGGGVNMRSGNNTIKNATISGNVSGTHGGGVYIINESKTVKDSTLTMENVTISGNTAAQFGGGLYASSNSIVTVTDATISGNKANTGGGIQVNEEAKVYLTADTGKAVSITDNTANTAGGGVLNWGELHLSGKVVIKDNICPNTYSGATKYPVNLATGTVINIDGALTGSEIYITHASRDTNEHNIGVLTRGYAAHNKDDGLDGFIRYDGPYCFKLNNGEIEIFSEIPNSVIANTPNSEKGLTSPKTRDNSNITLWMMLLALSYMGLCACTVLWKKRKNEQ